MSDVVIAGGGIIGISLAWRLAREGASVTVLERGQMGGQATGAAAGMLAPLAEATIPGPFLSFCLTGLRAYPEATLALREETGLDVAPYGPGMLRVAFTDVEVERLRSQWHWQRDSRLPLEWLASDEARRLEPALARTATGGILSPAEQHVDPSRLARAFALAAARQEVEMREGTPLTGWEVRRDRVTAAISGADRFPCGTVVLAGGAWSAELAGGLGATLPVFPIRGQILALKATPPPLEHTIYASEGYLVPKADGRVIVGATEDHAGFDARPTAAGLGSLLAMATSLVPGLGPAPFDSAWAGLRPATRDGLPLLGPLPGWGNVFVAAGHYRNGILLAPITAELLAAQIAGGAEDPLLRPFRPDRFLGETVNP